MINELSGILDIKDLHVFPARELTKKTKPAFQRVFNSAEGEIRTPDQGLMFLLVMI
jgi:hypothetical protein